VVPRQASDTLFLAIAHPVRRRILELLLEEDEVAAGALHAHFVMSMPAFSQHLRVLREAGLVADRRVGRSVRYRLTPEPLLELMAWMQHFAAAWRAAGPAGRVPGGPERG
jgi:DNA-binding transcriptional ArsR family regulator